MVGPMWSPMLFAPTEAVAFHGSCRDTFRSWNVLLPVRFCGERLPVGPMRSGSLHGRGAVAQASFMPE